MPLLGEMQEEVAVEVEDKVDDIVTNPDLGERGPSLQARRRSSTCSVSKAPTKAKNKQKRKQQNAQKLLAAAESDERSISAPQPMLASRPLPLLICSIGNPGSQYANTLHSAGHTVLNRLKEHLNYPAFQKSRQHGNGLLSKSFGGDDWTLWQSTSYMNECGKGVRDAHMAWSKAIADGEGRLVIVHDELEKPLGAVTLKTGQGLSAKGHNGLKSIMSVMGKTPFVRIGIGIGRPVSRESSDVARYVLKKMDSTEKTAIEGSVEQVIAKLKQIETG